MKLKLLLIILACSITAIAQVPARKMAVTIDDLPWVSVGPDSLSSGKRVTNRILAVLQKHHAPAIGFVNESKLQVPGEVESRTSLLRQWVRAGMILGNHTYSHPDFNRLSVGEFEAEILKGEVVTRRLMSPRLPYQLYFRHPMTHTGDTVEKKEAIEKFLSGRGYKVTPHTIENSDFIFNVDYVLALRSKDEISAAKIRAAYIDFTIGATEFAERISPQIFGREVTQTLLIHANDLNADCLDELLTRFAARGYRFVTLDEAMRDPAYATRDALVSKSGPTWLWRWMKSKGMSVSFADDPEPPQRVMDPYQKWLSTR